MRILIVEDEFLIAMELEDVVLSLGHDVVGPVGSMKQAKEVAGEAEIAIVDVRLSDGVTGPLVADHLHRLGVTVIFATGNPEAVMQSTSAIGVLQKPYRPELVAQAIGYAASVRNASSKLDLPDEMTLLPV